MIFQLVVLNVLNDQRVNLNSSIDYPWIIHDFPSIWANYNNSLTWIKAIWGWFPLLTMISSELAVSSNQFSMNNPLIIFCNQSHHGAQTLRWSGGRRSWNGSLKATSGGIEAQF